MNRHLVKPDVVGIDPCLTVTKSMDVIVRLKESAVVKDKLDIIEDKLWFDFLGWLQGLSYFMRWAATLEKSLKSKHVGRLRLHAYVEFEKAPDWTTLETVRFAGSLPNASPGHQTCNVNCFAGKTFPQENGSLEPGSVSLEPDPRKKMGRWNRAVFRWNLIPAKN